MSRFLMVLAMVGASVACTATANEPDETAVLAAAPESLAPISCAIDVTHVRGGVRLEAFARMSDPASEPIAYDFVITKHGGAGSSDIVQGGELAAEVEQSLGAVDLSLERGARYRAELTLHDGEGEVCAAEVRS